MSMAGVILLPSLNRPEQLKEFLKSYVDCKWTMPGMVLVDKKDPQLEAYTKIVYPKEWRLVLTEGRTMAAKVNEVWDQIINLDYVAILNDDHRIRTVKGDERILAAITGNNIIGTNDNWRAPQRLAGITVWSGKVLRTLGYIFPAGLEHLYVDSVHEHLGQKAQCINILMDVMVEHVHALRTGVKDETHNLAYGKEVSPGQWDANTGYWPNDKKVFEKWLAEDYEKDAQKLIDIQNKQGMMIATPSHDGNCSIQYALGLTDLAMHNQSQNIYFEMARVVGSSLIPHARNSLVDMFLKSKCQKLLFVDADQGFNRNAALHLFSSNKRIIAGVTPHKRYPINLNFEPLPEDNHFFKDLNNKSSEEFFAFAKARADVKGEIEVNRVGSGFFMIDRSVFEIMREHVEEYFPFDQREDVKHLEIFKMGAVGGRFRGEDFLFCSMAKDLKIPIYINVNSLVTHSGSHTFFIDERLKQ